MLENPTCPACDGNDWDVLGSKPFERDPVPSDSFLVLRHRVLFELWAPGQDRFVARIKLCRGCGLVIYTPRPTPPEIEAKYRLIISEGGREPTAREATLTELGRRRSEELYVALVPYLGDRDGGRLLDFGGGSGALLSAFAEAGLECSVVDYVRAVVPGVTRIGDTLASVDDEVSFDLALCSHVFEHVADPVAVARELRDHLAPDGLIFIEVPLELVGSLPPLREPVTHINFFSQTSLVVTLERAGFEVLDCSIQACLFESGLYRYGIRAVGRNAPAGAAPGRLPGSGETRALIESRYLSRVQMALRYPKVPRSSIESRLGSLTRLATRHPGAASD